MCVNATSSGSHSDLDQPEGVMATDQRSRTHGLTGLEKQNRQDCVDQPEDCYDLSGRKGTTIFKKKFSTEKSPEEDI